MTLLKIKTLSFIYRVWGWLPLPFWLRSFILRMVNARFTVGVGAVILDERRRVLLFHHTYRPDMPWGLPGGWLKAGENPVQAVEREVLEESSIRIAVGAPLVVRPLDAPHALDIVFGARYLAGAFRPCAEVDEAAFFFVEDLPPIYDSTRRAIDLALRAGSNGSAPASQDEEGARQ